MPDDVKPKHHIHSFPVDPSMTAMEAWKELCIFGRRVTNTGPAQSWVVKRCDGEECRLIEGNRECP